MKTKRLSYEEYRKLLLAKEKKDRPAKYVAGVVPVKKPKVEHKKTAPKKEVEMATSPKREKEILDSITQWVERSAN